MTAERFSQFAKWGGALLVLGAVANVYLVLRYREVYRDASRMDQSYAQQLALGNLEQRSLEAVMHDFAARAATDPAIAEILRKHGVNLPAAPAKAVRK